MCPLILCEKECVSRWLSGWLLWMACLCFSFVACDGSSNPLARDDEDGGTVIWSDGGGNPLDPIDSTDASEGDGGDEDQDGGDGPQEDAGIDEDGGQNEDLLPWGDCQEPVLLVGESGTLDLTWNEASPQGIHRGTCGGEGPEHVFLLSVDRPVVLEATLWGDVDGVLYVRKNCLSAQKEDQLACHDGLEEDRIQVPLDPGNYFLFADAFSSVAEGSSTLSWNLAEDPCNSTECGHGAQCQLSKSADGTLEPMCVCSDLFQIYSGPERGCLTDPCLINPCSSSPEKECVYSVEALPNHGCDDRNWTVLVFMNGDNNLYPNSVEDLREIQRATQHVDAMGNSRVVILYDGPRSQDTDILTVKGGRVRALPREDTFLGDQTELNMSEGKTLADFGVWALQTYPAKHVALVLWDHGSGWKNKNFSEVISQTSPRGFSNDVTSNPTDPEAEIFLSTGEFSLALAAIHEAHGQKLDLLAFDACLMGMYEVAHAASDHVNALLASEERIPAGGFDYERFLGPLFDDENTPQLGWVSSFPAAYLTISPMHYTMSLTDLTHWGDLAATFDVFAQTLANDLTDSATRETTLDALWRAQASTLKFNTPSHVDLGDLALKLSQDSEVTQALQNHAATLVTDLSQMVIARAAQANYAPSQGLAIYLPEPGQAPDPSYFLDTAPWAQTPWTRVLQNLPVKDE